VGSGVDGLQAARNKPVNIKTMRENDITLFFIMVLQNNYLKISQVI
jgi:hypothetical protein